MRKTVLLIENDQNDGRRTWRALQKINIANEKIVPVDGNMVASFLFLEGSILAGLKDPSFDLVLIDASHDEESSLRTISELKRSAYTRNAPIIYMAPEFGPETLTTAYALGASSCIVRPCDPIELDDCLLSLQMYWLLLNHVSPRPVPANPI